MIKVWWAFVVALGACAWALWGGGGTYLWGNGGGSSSDGGTAKMFTAKELSRFTGGAPLNLTRIAEVQAAAKAEESASADGAAAQAAKVKKEPGGVEEESGAQDDSSVDAESAPDESKDEAKEKDDVFVDPSVPIYLAVLGRVFMSQGQMHQAGGYQACRADLGHSSLGV